MKNQKVVRAIIGELIVKSLISSVAAAIFIFIIVTGFSDTLIQALKNINSTGSAFMFSLEILPIIFVVYFAINYGKYIVENSKKK